MAKRRRKHNAGEGLALAKTATAFSPCATCMLRNKGVCSVLLGEGPVDAPQFQTHLTARARQNIFHAGDPMPRIPVICAGYAFRYVQLTDGRRQILSFVLPGECIWGGALFREPLHFSVQAITEVHYCAYSRAALHDAIASVPAFAVGAAQLCVNDGIAADRTIVSLGRRSADERVAQLILDLTSRQMNGKPGRESRHDFPLKQVHIADAVGLTQIHVGRVLNRLKSAGILSLEEGVLTIFDRAALNRVGERGLGKD